MNIAELFIRRPVMTTLVMLGILLFGIMGYRLLPISDLPDVDFPTIQVSASLPGASPETMASSVATPLEKQFTTIAGLDNMNSTSTQGSTAITLQFNLWRNLDGAALDVQSAISAAARQLPPNMPAPPSFQKVNPADQPVIYLTLTSATLPLSQLDDYGETMMAQRISTVSGVAQVQVYGPQKYAVRIQLDPRALAGRGIGIDEAAEAVQNTNVNLPTGTLYGPMTSFTVQANGQLTEALAYALVIVTYQNGSPVRLSDLGRVIDGVENDKAAAWYNQERSISLAIFKQPGQNTVAVAGAVRRLLPTFPRKTAAGGRDAPHSLRPFPVDPRQRQRRALHAPAHALPGRARHLSLSRKCVGDHHPVARSSVFDRRHVRGHVPARVQPGQPVIDGPDPLGRLRRGRRDRDAGKHRPAHGEGRRRLRGGAQGLQGDRFHHPFDDDLARRRLHPRALHGRHRRPPLPRVCGHHRRGDSGLRVRFVVADPDALQPVLETPWRGEARADLQGDRAGLRSCLERLCTNLEAAARPSGQSPHLLRGRSPRDGVSLPQDPQGIPPHGRSGPRLRLHRRRAGNRFSGDESAPAGDRRDRPQPPRRRQHSSACGPRGNISVGNSGIVLAQFKPRSERKHSADEIIQDLRPKLARVTGIRAFLQVPPPIRLGGSLSKSQYQYTLQDSDTAELYRFAPVLEQKMRGLAGLQDVTSDLQLSNPQLNVAIDRDRAAALGISPQRIEDALYTAYGTRQISTIYAPNNEYQVIMELAPEFQANPNAISLLYVRSSSGQLAPLSSLGSISRGTGPLAVAHTGQLPSVTISFNLKPGVSLGDAVSAVDRVARQTLPPTIQMSFQGTAQAFQSSVAGLGLLLIVAIAVIYMVLGILYESFIHPITILTALPFAGVGALVTLFLFHTELSIYAFVGIIMLVGLVKKNGIMMVDFAIEAERNEGKSPREAIYEACLVRFRPIMMTTMAALMGTLPIAMGFGAGAESRRPLGLAVVGGLVFSQTLTLYVTPIFYIFMDRLQKQFGRKRKARPSPVKEPEEGALSATALRG